MNYIIILIIVKRFKVYNCLLVFTKIISNNLQLNVLPHTFDAWGFLDLRKSIDQHKITLVKKKTKNHFGWNIKQANKASAKDNKMFYTKICYFSKKINNPFYIVTFKLKMLFLVKCAFWIRGHLLVYPRINFSWLILNYSNIIKSITIRRC